MALSSARAQHSFEKAARNCNGGGVSRSMQHADNDDFEFLGQIINRITAVEGGAQIRRELMALRAGKWKILQAGKGCVDFIE